MNSLSIASQLAQSADLFLHDFLVDIKAPHSYETVATKIADKIKTEYFPTDKIKQERIELLAETNAMDLFVTRFDQHFKEYKTKINVDHCFHFTLHRVVPKVKAKIIALLTDDFDQHR